MINNNLKIYLDDLKKHKLLPKNIQISFWNGTYLVSCFDKTITHEISEDVFMGISRSKELAMFKSLTEYCERKIGKEFKHQLKFNTGRTDGLAAYPTKSLSSSFFARENALSEAIERFLWASWWDNANTEFQIESVKDQPMFKNLIIEFNLQDINSIKISSPDSKVKLEILIAKINNKGYISGGAASSDNFFSERRERAFGELIRHLLTFRKLDKYKNIERTFYEERLFLFGSGELNHFVKSKLLTPGNKKIQLPNLIEDVEMEHSFQNVIKLHRCLFENQPVFMGGKIERFCI